MLAQVGSSGVCGAGVTAGQGKGCWEAVPDAHTNPQDCQCQAGASLNL